MKDRRTSHHVTVGRPDFLCIDILLRARGYAEPSGWHDDEIRENVLLAAGTRLEVSHGQTLGIGKLAAELRQGAPRVLRQSSTAYPG